MKRLVLAISDFSLNFLCFSFLLVFLLYINERGGEKVAILIEWHFVLRSGLNLTIF